MTMTLVLVAFIVGGLAFVAGARWHFVFMTRWIEQQRQAEVQEYLESIMTCYSERDGNLIRFYELGTDRFLCQGDSALSAATAFAERFPGKLFFLAHTDAAVIEELGLDPEIYDIEDADETEHTGQ